MNKLLGAILALVLLCGVTPGAFAQAAAEEASLADHRVITINQPGVRLYDLVVHLFNKHRKVNRRHWRHIVGVGYGADEFWTWFRIENGLPDKPNLLGETDRTYRLPLSHAEHVARENHIRARAFVAERRRLVRGSSRLPDEAASLGR